MKTLFTSLFLVAGLSYGLAQEIDLTGQISIHNSRYRTGQIEYVADAFISAPFAGSTNTDSEGQFSLTFQGIGRGTAIRLSVEKAGWEVVNRKELNEVVLGRLRPIQIYLAQKGQLAEAQLELYNISKSALLRRHNRQIALLRQASAQSDSLIQDLEQKLNTEIANRFEAEELLNQQLADIQRRLPEMARQLASVNLDFVSDMYRTAYEYLRAGEVELAIKTLDEAILDEEARKIVERLGTSRAGLDSLALAEQLNLAALETLIRSQVLQARLFAHQKNYKAAADTYQEAVPYLLHTRKGKPSTELEVYFAAARWAILGGHPEISCSLFEKALATGSFSLPANKTPIPTDAIKESNYINLARRIQAQNP